MYKKTSFLNTKSKSKKLNKMMKPNFKIKAPVKSL